MSYVEDNDRVAAMLGQPAPLVSLWRRMGIRYRLTPDSLEALSGGRVVGRQHLDPGGYPAGPYVVVVNELADEEIAARDWPDDGRSAT